MLAAARAGFAARDVFDDCTTGITDSDRKLRLVSNASTVETGADDYALAGLAGTIHAISASTYPPSGAATTADFVWLYDQRLVPSSPGRIYYELLRDGNRSGRCALCNVRPSSTLDHHLPKTDHPIFAVTPDNLVPACRECNATKLASLTPTLNPYFDDLGSGPWLTVTIVPLTPPVFEFDIDPPGWWGPDLTVRAKAHFELFELAEMYAYQADRQLAGIRRRLADLLANHGPGAVAVHLQGEADSWSEGEPNSWEAALYAAAALSVWFCSGGFAG